MDNELENTHQKIKEYFDKTSAALVKDYAGTYGIANKLKNGQMYIINRKDTSKTWNYDSVESMVTDGWSLD